MGADLISNISEERKLPTKNELLSFVIIDNPNTKLKLIDVHQRDPINYFKQLSKFDFKYLLIIIKITNFYVVFV